MRNSVTIAAMFTAKKTLRSSWGKFALKVVMRTNKNRLTNRLNRWNAARTSLSNIQNMTITKKNAGDIMIISSMASALCQVNLALATM